MTTRPRCRTLRRPRGLKELFEGGAEFRGDGLVPLRDAHPGLALRADLAQPLLHLRGAAPRELQRSLHSLVVQI
jgi:hypothetical protein